MQLKHLIDNLQESIAITCYQVKTLEIVSHIRKYRADNKTKRAYIQVPSQYKC